MDRYIVESSGIGYQRGRRLEVPVTASYSMTLDNVFGNGYALKCAKMTARNTRGRLFSVVDGKSRQING